jgi:hypothetical protein
VFGPIPTGNWALGADVVSLFLSCLYFHFVECFCFLFKISERARARTCNQYFFIFFQIFKQNQQRDLLL